MAVDVIAELAFGWPKQRAGIERIESEQTLVLADAVAWGHELEAFDATSHPLLRKEAGGGIARLTCWVRQEVEHGVKWSVEERYAHDRRAAGTFLALTGGVALGIFGFGLPLLTFGALAGGLVGVAGLPETMRRLAPLAKTILSPGRPGTSEASDQLKDINEATAGLLAPAVIGGVGGLWVSGAIASLPVLGLAMAPIPLISLVGVGVVLAVKYEADKLIGQEIEKPLGQMMTQGIEWLGWKFNGDSDLVDRMEVVDIKDKSTKRSLSVSSLEDCWRERGAEVTVIPSAIPEIELSRVSMQGRPDVLLVNFVHEQSVSKTRLRMAFETAEKLGCGAVVLAGHDIEEVAKTIPVPDLVNYFQIPCMNLGPKAIQRELDGESFWNTGGDGGLEPREGPIPGFWSQNEGIDSRSSGFDEFAGVA